MTIRDLAFWLFVIFFVTLAMAVWTFIFIELYHPAFEFRDVFAVLDTDRGSLSVQWPKGSLSVWFSSKVFEWRIWPPP